MYIANNTCIYIVYPLKFDIFGLHVHMEYIHLVLLILHILLKQDTFVTNQC